MRDYECRRAREEGLCRRPPVGPRGGAHRGRAPRRGARLRRFRRGKAVLDVTDEGLAGQRRLRSRCRASPFERQGELGVIKDAARPCRHRVAQRSLEIGRRRPREDRIVIVVAEAEIAFVAKQAAHLAGDVTMVDAERALLLPANSTNGRPDVPRAPGNPRPRCRSPCIVSPAGARCTRPCLLPTRRDRLHALSLDIPGLRRIAFFSKWLWRETMPVSLRQSQMVKSLERQRGPQPTPPWNGGTAHRPARRPGQGPGRAPDTVIESDV